MAMNNQPLVAQVAAPQHFTPPTARELRGQALQRLQVGLFGLIAMLLLVGLANIIMDRARLSEEPAAGAQPAQGKAATDPLADIGVLPEADPSAKATAQSGR